MQRRIYHRHRLDRRERAEHTHVQGKPYTAVGEYATHRAASVGKRAAQADHSPCDTRIRLTADGKFKVVYREVTEPVAA